MIYKYINFVDNINFGSYVDLEVNLLTTSAGHIFFYLMAMERPEVRSNSYLDFRTGDLKGAAGMTFNY